MSSPCAQIEARSNHAFVHLVDSDQYSNERLARCLANLRSFGNWRDGHVRSTSFQQGTEPGQSLERWTSHLTHLLGSSDDTAPQDRNFPFIWRHKGLDLIVLGFIIR